MERRLYCLYGLENYPGTNRFIRRNATRDKNTSTGRFTMTKELDIKKILESVELLDQMGIDPICEFIEMCEKLCVHNAEKRYRY